MLAVCMLQALINSDVVINFTLLDIRHNQSKKQVSVLVAPFKLDGKPCHEMLLQKVIGCMLIKKQYTIWEAEGQK